MLHFYYLKWFVEFAGTVVPPYCSLLLCLQQMDHNYGQGDLVYRGIHSSQNGGTIVKRNKTLILEKNEYHNLFPNVILDIDECAAGTHNCSEKAECKNLKGRFNCTCKTGFAGHGQNCSGDH